MVHQRFAQVPVLSVTENVWLGRSGLRCDAAEARRRTGLAFHPDARAGDLSVGARQRLEIVKALAREVRVPILGEPTAVLPPQEVDERLAAPRWMTAGRGFIAIAIVVLGRWNPAGWFAAALVFGAGSALQSAFQAVGRGRHISSS